MGRGGGRKGERKRREEEEWGKGKSELVGSVEGIDVIFPTM